MAKQNICEIVSKEALAQCIYKFVIKAPFIAKEAKPGQFLEVRCSEGIDVILRRPISIADVNKQKELVSIIFQVRGRATEVLSKKTAGDSIDILGPLGKGFSILPQGSKIGLIGGGIGIFPLLFLAKELKNLEVYTFLGFRNKELVLLEDEFKAVSQELTTATDDGSYGFHGFAVDLLAKELKNVKFNMIYACGPLPMLKKVKEITITDNIPCEVSVEERMGCGVGACLGCAVKLKDGNDWRYGHVCKDGPVFKVQDIELN